MTGSAAAFLAREFVACLTVVHDTSGMRNSLLGGVTSETFLEGKR
jgi:hypothetical protein